MKFSEMPYERPDLTAAFTQFDAMAQAIAAAPGAADVLAQYAAFEKLAGHHGHTGGGAPHHRHARCLL